MSALLLVALAAVMLLASGGAALADTEVGSWSRTGSLPEGEYYGPATSLANGDVLALPGGEGERDIEIYDPSSGVWTSGPPLPASEIAWTAVVLAEGGALLLGQVPCTKSKGACVPTSLVYRLSASGSELLPAPPMREVHRRPIVVRLADGRVLVAGGFGYECPATVAGGYSCKPLGSAEIYNPARNEWSPTALMPQARGGAVGALLSDGTVLVVGDGREAIRYDPGSGSWSAAGETASDRTGALLFALPGDRAMALGSDAEAGFFGSYGGAGERRMLKCNPISGELFTTTSSAWTNFSPMPTGGEGCVEPHGALLTGGQVLLSPEGHYSATSASSPPYDLLDSEQRCWSTTATPLEAHMGGEVVELSDGRALVFGGRNPIGGNLSSAEVYMPPNTPTCSSATPSSPPSADLAPRFTGTTIAHRKRITVTRDGSIRVQMRCPATADGSCVGQTQIALVTATAAREKADGHAKRLYLGRASFIVAAGGTKWVTVRITDHMHPLRALIRRRHWATIIVTTAGHDNAGQVATTTALATLRG